MGRGGCPSTIGGELIGIPADAKTGFTKRDNVALEIGKCGLMKLINSLVFDKRIFSVLLMYSCR